MFSVNSIKILLSVAFSVGLKNNSASQDCCACQGGLYKMYLGFLESPAHLKIKQFGQNYLLGEVRAGFLTLEGPCRGCACLETGVLGAAAGQTLLSVPGLGSKVTSKVENSGLSFPCKI